MARDRTRLRPAGEVRAVFAARIAAHGPAVSLHGRRQADPTAPARWTAAAGRRVGSAVDRNRAKRRVRHAVRVAGLPAGFDIVAVAKPGALDVPFAALVEQIRSAGRRLAGRVAPQAGPEAFT